MTTYDDKMAAPGNGLFDGLSSEVRAAIWEFSLSCNGPIVPLQQRQGGNLFILPPDATDARGTVNTLEAISQTCRMFADDLINDPSFYRVNTFEFRDQEAVAVYLASIHPNKVSAIRSLTFQETPNPNWVPNWKFNMLRFLEQALPVSKNLARLQLKIAPEAREPLVEAESLSESFQPYTVLSNVADAQFSLTLNEIVRSLPKLTSIDISSYLEYENHEAEITNYTWRVEITKGGFRVFKDPLDDGSKSAGYAFYPTEEDFQNGSDHDPVDYFNNKVMDAFATVPHSMSGRRLHSKRSIKQCQADLLAHDPNYQLDIPYTNRSEHAGNAYGQLVPRPLLQPNDIGFHDKVHHWFPICDIREPDNPNMHFTEICVFGEGMNPPVTLTEREEVALEMEARGAPKVWVHTHCILQNRLPVHMKAAYMEDILDWYDEKIEEKLDSPGEVLNRPPSPGKVIQRYSESLEPVWTQFARHIAETHFRFLEAFGRKSRGAQ